MYIETKEIGPDGLIVDRDVPWSLPSPPAGDDEVKVEHVHLSGELRKEENGFAFAGDIATRASLPCSRCLEPCGLPLDLHFDLIYTTEPEPADRGEARVDEDRITQVRFDGARIDLDALLAEQIYLALPLKPLCREDCRGLCPHCGANRNLTTCACSDEREVDPRLAPLKKLI